MCYISRHNVLYSMPQRVICQDKVCYISRHNMLLYFTQNVLFYFKQNVLLYFSTKCVVIFYHKCVIILHGTTCTRLTIVCPTQHNHSVFWMELSATCLDTMCCIAQDIVQLATAQCIRCHTAYVLPRDTISFIPRHKVLCLIAHSVMSRGAVYCVSRWNVLRVLHNVLRRTHNVLRLTRNVSCLEAESVSCHGTLCLLSLRHMLRVKAKCFR